jgi:D-ribose pyranase
MANEFKSKVDESTVKKYLAHNLDFPVTTIPHEEFKKEVGKVMAIIHTGDDVPYSSVILKSG